MSEEEPKFQLSLVQVIAAAAAAITSAVILSYFGVAGTFVGTAIGSVLSTVGVAVYAHTIRRSRRRARQVWHRRHDAAARQDRSAPPTVHGPAPSTAWNHRELGAKPLAVPRKNLLAGPRTWRTLAISSAGVFLVALAIITAVEFAGGFSLTNLVHGKGARGSGPNAGCIVNPSDCGSATPTPGATPLPSAGPTTRSASTPTPSSTPTPMPTPTPTPTPTPPHGTSPQARATPGRTPPN